MIPFVCVRQTEKKLGKEVEDMKGFKLFSQHITIFFCRWVVVFSLAYRCGIEILRYPGSVHGARVGGLRTI